LQVAQRAPVIARLLEVDRESRRDLTGAVTPARLHALADSAVKFLASRGRDALVERVPIERVREFVSTRHRAVRPHARGQGAEEEPPLREPVTALPALYGVHRQRRGAPGRRELDPAHASRLQDALLVRAQAADLPLDHLAEIFGDTQVDVVERGVE